MSCNITKLDYLNETKQMIRNKIDPKCNKITDSTPFRDYVNYMSTNTPQNAAMSDSGTPDSIIGIATKEDI